MRHDRPGRGAPPAVMPSSIANSNPITWLDASGTWTRMPFATSCIDPALPSGTTAEAIRFGSGAALTRPGSLSQVGLQMMPGS
jgi:hypothetical protein